MSLRSPGGLTESDAFGEEGTQYESMDRRAAELQEWGIFQARRAFLEGFSLVHSPVSPHLRRKMICDRPSPFRTPDTSVTGNLQGDTERGQLEAMVMAHGARL